MSEASEVNPVERLVMRLAENRAAMNVVKSKIANLTTDGEGGYVNIDLSRFREGWYEFGYDWKGWVIAVEHVDADDSTSEEKQLAKLLDEKAQLRRELGNIRRSLCAAGRKLLRAA